MPLASVENFHSEFEKGWWIRTIRKAKKETEKKDDLQFSPGNVQNYYRFAPGPFRPKSKSFHPDQKLVCPKFLSYDLESNEWLSWIVTHYV